MKTKEARRWIIAEAALKLLLSTVPYPLIFGDMHVVPVSILNLLPDILFAGIPIVVAWTIQDVLIASKSTHSPQAIETKMNARKARKELGLWRTFWLLLCVFCTVSIVGFSSVGIMQILFRQSYLLWVYYPILGLIFGVYAAFLMVAYYKIKDHYSVSGTEHSSPYSSPK